MHAIIASHCTGCELCLPPCPVDCIGLIPVEVNSQWTADQARASRIRFERRQLRTQRERRQRLERQNRPSDDMAPGKSAAKTRIIAAAVGRAREKRQIAAKIRATHES
jgi:electron transport complex protein RnfB